MQTTTHVHTLSNVAQYSWRTSSAVVVSLALGYSSAVSGGLLFGITHYFLIRTFESWSNRPNFENRSKELVQETSQLVVKFLVSHLSIWGLFHLIGFKWTFAQVFVLSLAHVALACLVVSLVAAVLHIAHVSLLKAVGG
jgi:hypothetical protein